MAASPTTLLPFYGQYPAGYTPPATSGSSGNAGDGTSGTSSPVDIVDIRSTQAIGTFTAAAGDLFALRDLYQASAPSGSIVNYKVALRGDPNAPNTGRLMLGTQDVTGQTSFTPQQFSQLHFVAGPTGSSQDLVVVAQTGSRKADGTLTSLVDSPAIQITANVTGTRSLNALGALLTPATGSDASFVSVAQDASIHTALSGQSRPTLSTVGNLTAAAGDLFALRDLYHASASSGSILSYKVALRSDPNTPNTGRLMLGTQDVTGQTSFTPQQFSQLHFVAGPSGSSQDLVVVAQTGTRKSDGTLANLVDSSAVQITASVTGTRSLNAIGALLTPATGSDAGLVRVAQDASIHTAIGNQTTPSLSTVGNLTAAAGDLFAMRDLYQASAPSGSIVSYKVAVRSDQDPPNSGRLMLGNQDVTGQVDFTPQQFSQLHFVAGPTGSSQDLVVVAQTGTRKADGTLTNLVDSPAVQITAGVTGTRSLNAAGALLTPATGSDASFVSVAQDASIRTGLASQTRPSLTTVGNLTAAAGDLFALRDLYQVSASTGSIVSYKVALRDSQGISGNGRLMLGTQDVTGQTSFTPQQFSQLHFVAGPAGSSQDLVVVAQTGTQKADGTLTNLVDSPAVQITASVTGTRSLNAAGALLTPATGSDASFVDVAQDASIHTGLAGQSRPSLSTVGNLTAAAGDLLALRDLYQASAKTGSIVAYKVALRGDPNSSNAGRLMLGTQDVTGQTSFTPQQFSQLHLVAGPTGSSQDLVVVAQTGTRKADGTLINLVDSPAMQITTTVTGTRSLNAIGALLTPATGSDASFVSVAQDASIRTGLAGQSRPSLSSVGTPYAPATSLGALASLPGAYQSSGMPPSATTAFNVTSQYFGGIGGYQTLSTTRQNTNQMLAAWLLGTSGLGGFQTGGANLALQRFAVMAYQASQRSS